MNNDKVVIFYLLMLINHVAHVFEETWGRFWILNKVGLGLYLAINWVLFCIPVILFYFVLNNKRWAYKLSIGLCCLYDSARYWSQYCNNHNWEIFWWICWWVHRHRIVNHWPCDDILSYKRNSNQVNFNLDALCGEET